MRCPLHLLTMGKKKIPRASFLKKKKISIIVLLNFPSSSHGAKYFVSLNPKFNSSSMGKLQGIADFHLIRLHIPKHEASLPSLNPTNQSKLVPPSPVQCRAFRQLRTHLVIPTSRKILGCLHLQDVRRVKLT